MHVCLSNSTRAVSCLLCNLLLHTLDDQFCIWQSWAVAQVLTAHNTAAKLLLQSTKANCITVLVLYGRLAWSQGLTLAWATRVLAAFSHQPRWLMVSFELSYTDSIHFMSWARHVTTRHTIIVALQLQYRCITHRHFVQQLWGAGTRSSGLIV